MVTLHQVQFGEEFAAAEFDGKVLNVWQWVPVWSCDVVEPSVIPTWPESTVFFGYQVEWGGPGAVGWADDARVLQFAEFRVRN